MFAILSSGRNSLTSTLSSLYLRMVTKQQDEILYSTAWIYYRRWSRVFWMVFVLYLPVLAVVGRALQSMPSANTLILFAALVWMIAFAVIGYHKWNFQCPRCGELFFRKFDNRPWRMDWQLNPFA